MNTHEMREETEWMGFFSFRSNSSDGKNQCEKDNMTSFLAACSVANVGFKAHSTLDVNERYILKAKL